MVTIAVFGDIHGKQDLMYQTVLEWENQNDESIDAVLQVGDFETIRRDSDFKNYFAPSKYHHISDFADYHEGIKIAPTLTIFITGNHEAWDVLNKLKNGGFVAPHH